MRRTSTAVDGLRLAGDRHLRPGSAGRRPPRSIPGATVVGHGRRAARAPATSSSSSWRRRTGPTSRSGSGRSQAGRHVVVDKPIAMDVPEAETLIEAAERAGPDPVRLPEPPLGRRLPDRPALVERGRRSARSTASRPGSSDGATVGEAWREEADEAGGPHRDLGAHLVDQSLLLFGAARPRLRADGPPPARQPGRRLDVRRDRSRRRRALAPLDVADRRRGPVRGSGSAGSPASTSRRTSTRRRSQLLAGMRPDDPGFGEEPAGPLGSRLRARRLARAGPDRARRLPAVTTSGSGTRSAGDGELPVDPLDSVRGLRVLEAAERSARTRRRRSASRTA